MVAQMLDALGDCQFAGWGIMPNLQNLGKTIGQEEVFAGQYSMQDIGADVNISATTCNYYGKHRDSEESPKDTSIRMDSLPDTSITQHGAQAGYLKYPFNERIGIGDRKPHHARFLIGINTHPQERRRNKVDFGQIKNNRQIGFDQ
jgi:hypothetical protein